MPWKPTKERSLGSISDNRNERWKAAEARIAKNTHDPNPADLAIVAEEQDRWDAENPEDAPRNASGPQEGPDATPDPQNAF